MRKVLIGLAGLIILLIVVVAVAVSNINTYLEENRDSLTKLASDAAGREVEFDKAEVTFSGGLAVRVAGLRVAEDARFGESDFLDLDDAYVGVRILPALQRRIEVSGIRLDAPTIRVIQTKDGFNFASLGGGGAAEPTEESAPPPGEDEQGGGMAVAIAALEIVDGTIVYEDRTGADGLSLVVEEFETSGTDLALDGPIEIDFAGVVRSTKSKDEGLRTPISGTVAIEDLATMEGAVSLRSPAFHPATFGVRLEEGEEAQVERIDSLALDVDLTADPAKSGYPIELRSSAARLAGFDLDDISIDLVFTPGAGPGKASKVDLDQVKIGLAGGTVELEGDVVLGEPGRSPFDLKSQIRSLDLGELATILLGVPHGALSGDLGGDVNLKGDSLEWESLKKSLIGSLRLEVGEGALEQVNVLNTLVGRLMADPGLGQLAANSLRDVAPNSLSGNRTPFEGIDMALEIIDGAVHAKNLSMNAGEFALEAVGEVGLDGKVAAEGKIRFSKDLSKKILAKADRLGPLLGDGDRVTLPLRLGGTTDSPTIVPDLSELSAAATRELESQAIDKLGDAIFGKQRGDSKDSGDGNGRSDKDRLREGLGRFLGR